MSLELYFLDQKVGALRRHSRHRFRLDWGEEVPSPTLLEFQERREEEVSRAHFLIAPRQG